MLRLLDLLEMRSWAGNAAHTALGLSGALALGLTFHSQVAVSSAPASAPASVLAELPAEAESDDFGSFALAELPNADTALTEVSLTGDAFAEDSALTRSIRDAALQFAEERRCLATGLYFEARGESQAGQLAVAEVVLNRVASERYPNSICEVVYQGSARVTGCQFSFTCDGVSGDPRDRRAWAKASRTASHVLMGKVREPVIGEGVTHYHADYVNPFWADTRYKVTKIGRHIFYRNPDLPAQRS